MTWTYSGNPANSSLDLVRFTIGDVDQNDPLLQDEEINYCISSESSINGALALSCESIANRFMKEADVKMGTSIQLDLTSRAEAWTKRTQMYRRRASASSAPSVGGLSQSEEQLALSNPDRTGPYFYKDMMKDRELF